MPSLTRAFGVGAAALALAAAVGVPAMAAQQAASQRAPGSTQEYYLALGDSAAVGSQPNAQGIGTPTNQGYADQLYSSLRSSDPGLQLAKLGCPGETSATFVNGGICGYSGDERYSLTADTGSQLAAALAFIAAHRGHVSLITLDIGANDLTPCLGLGSVSATSACLPPVFAVLRQNLSATLAQLRSADPQATIVGMTYFDPDLADWFSGSAGEALAQESISLTTEFRQVLMTVYQQAGVPVADVFTAFRTTDITGTMVLPSRGTVPVDVGLICEWTWECAPAPQGPNEHANTAGYGVIAQTFLTTLDSAGYRP